jgi:RNA polymerase sigma-70 factor (ECF subfamily)
VFRIGFEHRSRFRPVHESALPWLYGLATNLLLKHWRRESRQMRALARLKGGWPEDEHDAAAVDARVDAQALGGQLLAALARLPQADRDVLLLFAWEELSYEEVATALGIPEGTVRSRLNRARRSLRAFLGDLDYAMPALGVATGKDAG